MVRVEGGEMRAFIGWGGKEIRSHISQAFQAVGSLLGCQFNAPPRLCWDEGTGHPGTLSTAARGWVLPGPQDPPAQPGYLKVSV